ncbi:MAG: M48 family metallopeptidase [Deltaproteobacteria bacterium]|nr:M48 family metallopeptidase [Deltaproteobacteria bacterium]
MPDFFHNTLKNEIITEHVRNSRQGYLMRLLRVFTILLIVSFISYGCASLPGGKEPSDADINAEAAKAYADVKSKARFSSNAEWNGMVQRVARRIEVASGEPFQWEAVLIESPEVNAWCMPGGKIAVYTGIMPVLKTEGALAAVLGHEVAHATKRHGKQRYARAIKDAYLGAGIGIAGVVASQFLCKDPKCKLFAGLGAAAAGLAVTFFSLKYSRGDETEADQVGQQYMAKAGYDPSEASRLWERMASAGGSKPPELLSTHPSDSTRRANLDGWLPGAMALYNAAPQKYGTGAPVR